MGLDQDHLARGALGESRRALGNPCGGEEIGDDHRGARGEPIDDTTIVIAAAAQHELVVQPERLGAPVQRARVLEDDRVDAVVGVLVGGVEPLMDEQWLPETVGLKDGVPQRPVLLEPVRGLHPVQDVLPLRLGADPVARHLAEGELVGDKGGLEGVQGGHANQRVGGGARFPSPLLFLHRRPRPAGSGGAVCVTGNFLTRLEYERRWGLTGP